MAKVNKPCPLMTDASHEKVPCTQVCPLWVVASNGAGKCSLAWLGSIVAEEYVQRMNYEKRRKEEEEDE